ncbi:MAG TPA: alpha/beta family hydrolase [Bauldia sp.]|nr:alpha/beta family hydrolase [Bauldia sp.]
MARSTTGTGDRVAQATRIAVGGGFVSGLFDAAENPAAAYVFAHGAGAGMGHPFMSAVAHELAAHGISTLRYQFPYMEAKKRRPDSPAVAEATVSAAVARAGELAGGVPLFAGGKSFGGRMTSQAAADGLLPGIAGLVFFGFPLHPPGKPGTERAAHLERVAVPMLFLQGTRDEFATLGLLEETVKRLPQATLHLVPDGDHSFRVPARSGRKENGVRGELIAVVRTWIDQLAARRQI